MKRTQNPTSELTVRVKGKNLPVTPALHDQVVEKMSRLDKYLDRLQSIDVELSTEKTRDAAHHNHVEATTRVAGKAVRVCTSHEDMYAAIDEAVDKLYRQLNRHKERLKGHHATKPSELVGDAALAVTDGADVAVENSEITRERLDLEPMFDDEALAEFRASSDQFLVFLNARNEQVNVLYRREDGGFALIEPRVG